MKFNCSCEIREQGSEYLLCRLHNLENLTEIYIDLKK